MFTVPFDDLAVMFGEDVAVGGATRTGIVSTETVLDRDLSHEATVLSLPGGSDVARGTAVMFRGSTWKVQQRLEGSDPGWARYMISEVH